ncbi:PfkB family carbohydrate kinase, partial [Rhizobacter sp. P5_C2]
TKAVDTTGAGDTFIGAFAAARCAGAALHAAIAHAQQAAAFSVARPGTIDSMPFARDLQPALSPS